MRSDWRWVGLFSLLVALGGCSLPAETAWQPQVTEGMAPTASRSLADSAKRDFHAGRFGLAIKAFSALAARDPRSIEALNGLAASYDRIGRYDLAAREYRKALLRAPNSPQTLNNIGYSAFLQGRPFLALAFFGEALAVGGEIPVARNNRRLVERFIQEQSLEDCRDSEKQRANVPEKDHPAAAPRGRAGVHLQRVGLYVERLVTRTSYPTARERAEFERALRLLTAPKADSGREPMAWRGTCERSPQPQPDQNSDLRPVVGPKDRAARPTRLDRRAYARQVPGFAELGVFTATGLLVDRRPQLIPLGS